MDWNQPILAGEYSRRASHDLFVYGTMLRGKPNHGRLAKANFITTAMTAQPQWDLKTLRRDRGWLIPVALPGKFRIQGELYRVTGPDLELIDLAEGHPYLYQRVPVRLLGRNSPVWIYRYGENRAFFPHGIEYSDGTVRYVGD